MVEEKKGKEKNNNDFSLFAFHSFITVNFGVVEVAKREKFTENGKIRRRREKKRL